MALYVIYIPLGLTRSLLGQARQAVHPATYTHSTYGRLLRSAGFSDLEEMDCTKEYLRVARAWYEARERHMDALARSEGESNYRERQADRKRGIEAIEAGLVRPEDAALLDLELGSPVLNICWLAISSTYLPVEYSTAVFRADRYSYEVELERKSL